jgi:hypothetical protein
VLWKINKLKVKEIAASVFFPFLGVALIAIYYWFTSRFYHTVNTDVNMPEYLIGFYKSRYGLVSMAYVLIFYLFSFVSLVGPYLILFFVFFSWNNINRVLKGKAALFVLMIFSGLVSFSVFIFISNSWQLYQNMLVPVMAISILLLVEELIISKSLLAKIIGILVIIFNLTFNLYLYDGGFKKGERIDVDFYSKVLKLTEGKSEIAKFAVFSAYDISMPSSYKIPVLNYPGLNFGLFFNDFFPTNLTVHSIPVSTQPELEFWELNAIHSTPFFQYVKMGKEALTFNSIESSQLKFIKENKINFILYKDLSIIPEDVLELEVENLRNEQEGYGVLILKFD